MAMESSHLAAFGLSGDIQELPSEEVVDEQGEDQEEPEEALEDEESQEYGEEYEDDESNEVEDDDEEDEEPEEELTKEQEVLRKFQSKNDKLSHENEVLKQQLAQFYQEFQDFKSKDSQQEEQDVDLDLDDDDLIDGKTLKQYLAKQGQKPKTPNNEEEKVVKNQWLNQRDDLTAVNQFINDNNLAQDSELTSIPTDSVGLYYAVKAKMLESKIKEFEHKAKQLEKIKRKRGKVPPVGGRGPIQRKAKPALSDFESRLMNFAEKRGIKIG